MRISIRILLFILLTSFAIADPPDEDVHRPVIPGKRGPYVQIDLGFNLSFLDGNPNVRFPTGGEGPTNLYNSASGVAPLIGATIGYRFSPLFALAFRADYDARYAGREGRTGDTATLFDEFRFPISQSVESVDKEYSLGVDYLSFSLLGNIAVDELFFFLGPTISIPLAREYQETNTITDQSSVHVYFPFTPDASKQISGTADGTDNVRTRVSFKFGAGYAIPLAPDIDLVPQIAYDMGLTGVLTNDEIFTMHPPAGTSFSSAALNHEMVINSLQATIGIRINF